MDLGMFIISNNVVERLNMRFKPCACIEGKELVKN